MILRLLLSLLLIKMTSSHMDTTTCGAQKQCIFVPTGCQTSGSCRQIFTYSTGDDNWAEIELFSTNNSPGNNYLAVGFSQDDLMGDDFVTHCAFPEMGQPEVHVTYNFGKSNSPPMEEQEVEAEKDYLHMIHAHKEENEMYCYFRQNSSKAKLQFYPDLDNKFQIFLARGITKKPRSIGIHSLDPSSPDFPFISESKINIRQKKTIQQATDANLSSTSNISDAFSNNNDETEVLLSKEVKYWLIRIHGILMIFSWLVLIALAILSARFLRDHFPSSSPFGLKWWFHLHRSFNLFALPLILVSVLLVFIAKDWEWKGPLSSQSMDVNLNPGSIHSLLGAVAVVISFVQPLLALMRCAPDTGARPIFNWTHRSLGLIGIAFAIIAILIAANSFRRLWANSVWSLVIVLFYLVVTILVVILLEILSYLKTKDSHKTSSMEMHHRTSQKYDDRGKVISSTRIIKQRPMYCIGFLYLAYALFAISIVSILVVMLIV